MELNPHTLIRIKTMVLTGLTISKPTRYPRFITTEQEEKLYEVITTKTPNEVILGGGKIRILI